MPARLTVAKIVASSTPSVWSQAYHAGGLTAVLSLNKTPESEEENSSLPIIGKEVLNNLEAEYFALPEKDLEGLKHAVTISIKNVDPSISISFTIGCCLNNIFYAVIVGGGKIYLKRDDKFGVLLQSAESELVSSSGFLQNKDLVILETLQFANTISRDHVENALDHNSPEEISETLAPIVHRTENGGSSAIIFEFDEEIPASFEKKIEDEEKEEVFQTPKRSVNFKRPSINLSHMQKLYLSIAVLLIIALVASIIIFQSRQNNEKTQALFNQIYSPAKQDYEDGQGLLTLNKNLALDDFNKAQVILTKNKNAFPTGSSEQKQINDLLNQVNGALSSVANVNTVTMNKTDSSSSPYLAFAQNHQGFFAEDSSNFYFGDNLGVTQVNKNTNKSQKIITNSGDYKNIGGLGVYFGNIYVLDTKDGILKYVSGSSGFGKTNYFSSGVNPDLSNAASLAIDGSVWILKKDGTILNFLKGSPNSFSVSGLDKTLSSPTQIVTSTDDNNIYILDNGNSRIVSLKKDGTFVAQYNNTLLKSATQMDIDEKNSKAYVLSGGTIYEFDLK